MHSLNIATMAFLGIDSFWFFRTITSKFKTQVINLSEESDQKSSEDFQWQFLIT